MSSLSTNGLIFNGSPRFGTQALEGQLIDNEQEQQVIELIRRHHKSGKSTRAIAAWLNQQGHRTKRGSERQSAQIARILTRLKSA